MALVASCVDDLRLSGPAFDVHVMHHGFTLETRRWIDVLIVVDSSASATGHRDTLRANMHGLAASLRTAGRDPDLQVGFVTAGCSDGVVQAAAAHDGRFLIDARGPDGVRSRNFDGELGDAMLASFDALPATCPEHVPLATILAALDDPANRGFARDDAEFAAVILTATDDASPAPVVDIARQLRAREHDDARVAVAIAFGPCRADQPRRTATAAPRLQALIDALPNRSTATSICWQDLSGVLSVLGELPQGLVSNPCVAFELPEAADCSASIFPEGVEQLVPRCGDRPQAAACWRLERDPSWCPGGSHQLAAFPAYQPTPKRVQAVVECALPSVL